MESSRYGTLNDEFRFTVDGVSSEHIVTTQAIAVDNFDLYDDISTPRGVIPKNIIKFGEVNRTNDFLERSFTIVNEGQSSLFIRKVESSSSAIRAIVEQGAELKPGETLKITVRLYPAYIGDSDLPFTGRITLTTNDMLQPMKLIRAARYYEPAVDVDACSAPIGHLLYSFRSSHPVWSIVLFAVIYIYAVLRLSRATVRVDLYSQSTLAAISLSAVTLFGSVVSSNYPLLIVVALLIAEAFGRLLYCFGPSVRAHYLFTAMLAFGAMPLVDSALIPLSVVIPIAVILLRLTFREMVCIFHYQASIFRTL